MSTASASATLPARKLQERLNANSPGNGAALVRSRSGQSVEDRMGQSAPPGFLPRLKPSAQKLLNDLRALSALPQRVVGNGRWSAIGTASNQIVFRTLRNEYGGTNGSSAAAIQLRIAMNTPASIAAAFRVELDPAHLAGVTVSLIRHTDNQLPSTGINRTAMTNEGGGVFTAAVANTFGSTPYYGIEVRLVSTDSTSDASLHDEFFNVLRVRMSHAGVDVMDSEQVVGGNKLCQQVSASQVAGFRRQQIEVGGAPVYFTHNGCVSGAHARYVWAAHNVAAGGDGSELSPLSLADARALHDAGDTDVILLYPGRYVLAGNRPLNVFYAPGRESLRVACLDGRAVLDVGLSVPAASWTNNGNGTYSYTYDPVNHYNKGNILAGSNDAYLMLSALLDQNLEKVATLGEVAGKNWSYYFDRATLKFTLRCDGASVSDAVVCEGGNIISAPGCALLQALNVTGYGQQASVVNITSGGNYELFGVRAELGCPVGMSFRLDNCDGIAVGCFSRRARIDNFNMHGDGHHELYDCEGHWAQDDNVSPHDNCTLYMRGGWYSNPGKANAVSAFGARTVADRVRSSGAKHGTSSNAAPGTVGGFVALSASTDTRVTTMLAIDCLSDDDDYGVLSSGSKSVGVDFGSLITAARVAPVCSRAWSTNGVGYVATFDRPAADVSAVDPARVAYLRSGS